MKTNHRLNLKKVSYSPSKLSQKDTISNQRNRFAQNNKRLEFLPQITFGLIILALGSGIIWLYWPNSTSNQTNTSLNPQQALIEIPATQNQVSPSFNNTSEQIEVKESFTITDEGGVQCQIIRTASQPNSITTTGLNANGWWIPKSDNTCKNDILGINILRLDQEQYKVIQNQLTNTYTSIQLLDDKNIYGIFYGATSTPKIDGQVYLISLTNGIIDGSYFFDTSKAYAQKRIGDLTFYLDSGCHAPRTQPCILWKIDNYSGVITLVKKNVGLTGQGEAYELIQSRSLTFSNTQDYKNGINLIYRAPDLNQTILLRIATNNNTNSISSTIELTLGDDNYQRYL